MHPGLRLILPAVIMLYNRGAPAPAVPDQLADFPRRSRCIPIYHIQWEKASRVETTIYYFTGTGNSLKIAKDLKKRAGEHPDNPDLRLEYGGNR